MNMCIVNHKMKCNECNRYYKFYRIEKSKKYSNKINNVNVTVNSLMKYVLCDMSIVNL